MRGQGRLRPSPSLLVAFAALMVALGGTSYAIAQLPANSVGTKQLKRNAVTTAKVKNRSLLANDFKSGQLPRGARGPGGPQGAPGAPGTPGATNVTVRVGAGAIGSSTASCSPGERAVGGGGLTPDSYLDESRPQPESGTPTSWVAGTDDISTVTAYVICAAP
jgi:hypothetical protein